ncbi:cytochrome c biogenesis heme-transporting ATPase CcmA [Arhodomonas sp. AD133]|uniref:cytochrome c biogenesis heme-transporting ATPase CcmA n=1 Tax=Arhodomonas sp. AD133 TaxID=3415009 RepID=UPI003EB9736F
MLEATDLIISRGERLLIDELDVRVNAGEVLHVTGPNGSGKTTLLRTLAGLTLPEEGTVCWHGENIRRDGGTFRAALLWVGHQPGIKLELTPTENLRVFAHLHGSPSLAPEEALTRIGLGERLTLPCRHLSAGQRRRVALARLLCEPAEAWILDEPFTALDRSAVAALEARLAEHAGAGGITVLTSHQPVQLDGLTVRHLELGNG